MCCLNSFKAGACYTSAMIVLALAMPELIYPGTGQDREFDLARMPAELAKDADAVARLNALAFTVESPGKATLRVRQAFTILNDKGRELGKVYVGYDKFRQLADLRGWLFDTQGEKIRDLKKSDINDYSAIADYSLYEDSRVRAAELYYDSYPYTVVFEYEMNYNGLISWPSWYPFLSRAPVERSSFEVSVPADMPIRYHLRDVEPAPQIEQVATRKILRWEAANLPKWKHEPYSPGGAPCILTAPSAFEIAGYAGDMSSWAAFGSWIYQLYNGRTTLPAPALSEIQNLCGNAASPREKIQRLYEYLQAKTRYVSVQLGIGGWQPFDAAYVYQRGYGDCKALTNFMLALLQAAEVEAYPVLIRHGEDAPAVIADFPCNQFNHVILCVPMAPDTLWLECTSQTAPFGHLGAGNEDRNVLMVTPEGGKLVRTPRSKSTDNQQIRRGAVTLSETGDAVAEVRTRYTGNQQDHVRWALAKSTPREREDWLREEIDVPSFRLTSADFSEAEGKRTEITLPVKLELPRFASRSGVSRLFLRPNLMERRTYIPPEVKERQQPVEFDYAYLDTDTISYHLPANFRIEAAPPTFALDTPFGSYHASTTLNAGTLEYVRRLEIRERSLPADQYEAYRQFIADVVKADNAQVVLVRKF
jgi:Domain of Unknown Function with PDB structure (DUF3857)/Transglutaminase-like superfamily